LLLAESDEQTLRGFDNLSQVAWVSGFELQSDEYILDPCDFFSWLARLLLSSLARWQRQKQPGLFSGGAPADVEKKRQESRIDYPDGGLKVFFNTSTQRWAQMIGAAWRYNKPLIRLASRPELIKHRSCLSSISQDGVKMPMAPLP